MRHKITPRLLQEALIGLCLVARARGDDVQAASLAEQARAWALEAGDPFSRRIADSLDARIALDASGRITPRLLQWAIIGFERQPAERRANRDRDVVGRIPTQPRGNESANRSRADHCDVRHNTDRRAITSRRLYSSQAANLISAPSFRAVVSP